MMKYERIVYDVMEGSISQIQWMKRQLLEMKLLKGMDGTEAQINKLVEDLDALTIEFYRRKYDAAVAAGIPVEGKRP